MRRTFAIVLTLILLVQGLLVPQPLVAAPAAPVAIINELDADNVGTDAAEFIELYDGGTGNTSLNGLVVVFYNGSNDQSYAVYDLDGYSTDANGYFLLGNAALTPGITFADNFLQNGQDAVALYQANAADFPTGTAITTANLIDAIVYDTADADDPALLVLLNASQPQINESSNGANDTESNQRCPNGSGGARNTDTYAQFAPTPGAANLCGADAAPTVASTSPAADATGVAVDANISVTFSEAVNVTGAWYGISCATSGAHTATVAGGPTAFTLDPGADFANSETCTVTIYAAQVTDQDGTPDNLAADYVWSFTTAGAAIAHPVVISQVYGGGGNSGALYKNDFIELYNRGSADVDITGWSVQYASSTGSSWQVTTVSGVIKPGRYYLVQEAAGSGGTLDLPEPDATGAIFMGAANGKVALVNNSTVLSGACPGGVEDLVGFGSANCSETSPTPGLSSTTAALRKSDGAQDTDDNSFDFVVGAPSPRNSDYPFTATGLATPDLLFGGASTLLTVAVTPDIDPPGTGLGVTCDLSPIGGAAAQTFYDDGTNGDAAAGDNTFSFSAVVAVGTTPGAKSLACTASDAQARSIGATIKLTVLTILPIGTVNGPVLDGDSGTAHQSPYKDQTVAVQGVIYEKTLQAISNSANTYKGFFIQNTVATRDADPNTSDGLFVFMSTAGAIGAYTPAVGDEIVLVGKVSEYYNMTELVSPLTVLAVLRSGVDLEAELAPVVVDPPESLADANRYWERLQGMRVQVPANSIVLGGRSVFSPADAEVWVARPDSTVALRTEPYERRAFRDAHPLDVNYDPANWDGNGYRILLGSLGIKGSTGDAQALIAPASTFDVVTNAPIGGLNYTFSKYRIEITDQPTLSEGVDPAANNPPQAFDRSLGYSIVDFNLENLYDYRDDPFSGCDFATNTTGCPVVAPFTGSAVTPPYDYVPASEAVFQARLVDIAGQIIDDLHSPDILMVQEIEDQDVCIVSGGALSCDVADNADGKPDALQDLALTIAALGGPAYDAAFDRDSSDLRGIAPAYLYRTDRVELLPAAGDPILGSDPAIGSYTGVPHNSDVSNPKTLNAVLPDGVTACDTTWVFPRAPSVALFRIYSTSVGVGNSRDVYVVNNHFKSGPDTCVGHRTEQAKYNAAIVAALQAANPAARIVVGGDLNVYPLPDNTALGAPEQLAALYDPALGLTNLWDVLLAEAPAAAYSYVYLGMAQTLDQMFANDLQLVALDQFRIAHINSDFPADYPGDGARGTSDHDPNMAVFVLSVPPTADAGGPYTVVEGQQITLSGSGSDPEGDALTFAWDLDGDGIFETPGQSVTFTAPSGPADVLVGLQVCDDQGACTTATATVSVTNVPPVVSNNRPVQAVLLFGPIVPVSVSATDITADMEHASVTTVWSANGGPLQNGLPADLTLMPGDCAASGAESTCTWILTGTMLVSPGTYTVHVTVTDPDGGVGSTEIRIVVVIVDPNYPPTAEAGGPYVVAEGAQTTLTGTGVDPDGDRITFHWDLDSDGSYETAGQTVSFYGDDGPAVRTVTLQVCDDDGACREDTATITITNVPPLVTNNLAAQLTPRYTPIQAVTISAADVPGDVPFGVSTAWTKDGGAANGGLPAGLTLTAGSCAPGSPLTTCTWQMGGVAQMGRGLYRVTVSFDDHDGGVSSTAIEITVPNEEPTANAGGPYTVNEGEQIALQGAGTDPEGDPLTYVWDLDNNGTFETAGQNPTFSALNLDGPATQTVGLQVCDDRDACDDATATITITNVAPLVTNDLPAQTVQYPNPVAAVTVTYSDVTPDMPLTVATTWTLNGGAAQPGLPAGLALTAPVCTPGASGTTCTLSTQAGSKLAVGEYAVTVTVSDDDGGVASTEFAITVEAAKFFLPLLGR